MITESLGLVDDGVLNVEPAKLKSLTLTQLAYGIEKMQEAENSLESEHKMELDKLEAEYQSVMRNHERDKNSVLDRHDRENISYKKNLTEIGSKKQNLQSELRLQERMACFVSSNHLKL